MRTTTHVALELDQTAVAVNQVDKLAEFFKAEGFTIDNCHSMFGWADANYLIFDVTAEKGVEINPYYAPKPVILANALDRQLRMARENISIISFTQPFSDCPLTYILFYST